MNILGIDPGKSKCGLAVVGEDGQLLHQEAVLEKLPLEKIRLLIGQYRPVRIILGRGTGYKDWLTCLAKLAKIEIFLVEEKYSTLEARKLYWHLRGRQGWRRLVPVSLLLPPEPYDGYAAAVLARRQLIKVVKAPLA